MEPQWLNGKKHVFVCIYINLFCEGILKSELHVVSMQNVLSGVTLFIMHG